MRKIFEIIMITLLTMSFGRTSLAEGGQTNICFKRQEIESYKNDCDLCESKLRNTNDLLSFCLENPNIAFYQKKEFVLILGALALVATSFALSK